MKNDMFDDNLETIDSFENPEDEELINTETGDNSTLDARRRLEKKLEEKRLRRELDDFIDY